MLLTLDKMQADENLSVEKAKEPKKIIIDYGGPNVAKPLHVGHLRSAIIGESIKRMGRFLGHEVIGDVHLGDWGLQMGLIIVELKKRKPELVYFDESYTGEYPKEAPFTIGELEEIYPAASAYSKEHPEYKEAAMQATYLLQHGHRGYQAILKHIMEVSVTDLKRNYANLNVSFDLWKGESRCAAVHSSDGGGHERTGPGIRRSGSPGRGCQGRDRYKRSSALYDPEIGRSIPLYHHRPGYHRPAYGGLSAG